MDDFFIKYIKIANYKGFAEEQKIDFTYPDNDLSGLNILVGPNNSGKTTIFNGINKLFEYDLYVAKSERRNNKQFNISICDKNNTIINITNNVAKKIIDKSHTETGVLNFNQIDFIKSRRNWDSTIDSNIPQIFIYPIAQLQLNSYLEYKREYDYKNTIETYDKDLLFSTLFAHTMMNNVEYKQKIISIMKDIVPDFEDLGVEKDDFNTQPYIQYKTKNGETHKADKLGEGTLNLLRIAFSLAYEDNNIHTIMIDEPELSLHPQAQKKLAKLLLKHSYKKQIIVATHSPYFIMWDILEKGGKIIRLNKENDACRVNQIRNPKKYLELLKGNYQQPHILDTASKEIFFSDKILFLEGQEDVGIINQYAKDEEIEINFDIFGYGAGDANNIKYFIEMAKDLGIKCGAIFDGDKQTEADELIKTYSNDNDVMIKILPTSDIRDKPKRDDMAIIGKMGCFNRKGEIKKEYKQIFDGILRDFANFFQ